MNNTAKKIDTRLGVFGDIKMEDYHGEALAFAYSNSDLKEALTSTANVLARRKLPKDSNALRMGRALHMRLEHYKNQDAYLEQVEVKINGTTTEGKAQKKAYDMGLITKLLLSQSEWDEIELMLKGVLANETSRDLLERQGPAEETFIWEDPDTGVICKCRPDKRIVSHPNYGDNILIDWKTTASCDEAKLRYAVRDFKYHMQAAFVTDGARAVLGKEPGPFANVFIEKASGRVVCGLVNDMDIQVGREQYKEALKRISQAQKSGIWTGFVDLSLPETRF